MSKLNGVTEQVKKHKKLAIVIAVILIAAIAGGVIVSNASEKKAQMEALMNQTQTSKVEKRTLVSSVSATGTLTSINSKDVVVNLSGVEVESVSVQLGDVVEEGQVLCEFDSEDIEENLAEAKTALSVAQQKTQMDLTAAQRNLEDAKEDYDTNLKRGNTDLDAAYNDYAVALEDVEEAESAWMTAKEDTIAYLSEYQYREELVNQKKAQLDAAGGTSDIYQQGFLEAREQLAQYTSANGVTLGSGAMDKIGLGNDLSQLTVGDNVDGMTYDFSTGDLAVQAEIRKRIDALTTLQTSYKNVFQLEQEYSQLQQSASSMQSKYSVALQNESSAEKVYEQSVSASQSQLSAYQKQQRNLDDTTKNAENNIINKTETLTTAQLNALSSGNTEEDKVEQYQQQLEDCTVEAPISGVISAVNIEAGDTYNGTAIVTIDDISSFEVTAQIDEYDIGKIEKGQKVMIKTNATGEEELEGTVKNISPKASTGGSEVTYTVIISVDTPNEMLRMDMTARLSIILESKENVLTVPYEAVQEDESGKYYVEVIGEASEIKPNTEANVTDKKTEDESSRPQEIKADSNRKMPGSSKGENASVTARRIYVEKGIESDYYIEIISNEITEGLEVVIPKTTGDFNNIQNMMMHQGPMGGF